MTKILLGVTEFLIRLRKRENIMELAKKEVKREEKNANVVGGLFLVFFVNEWNVFLAER